jgi:hypothetical protein
MRGFSPAFRASLTWLAAGVVAGGLAGAVALLLPGGFSRMALTGGWATAVVNAWISRRLNRQAMGPGRQAFLRWGIIGNVLRILMLLGILTIVISAHRTVRNSFFASFFAGLFVFMTVEITELFRLDSGKREMT